MKRLILCSAVATSLIFLAACSGDPTDSLRGGVEKLNPTPSQIFLVQGRTGAVVVSATDGQGNQVETAFELTNTGPGLSVERDPTFRPVYLNDTLLAPPERDALFRYRVTANQLVSSSFTITAEGKDVVVPVNVTPDPLLIPQAAVATSGPNPQDTVTLTLPAPYAFQGTASVAFDVGNAVVVGRATDGSTLKVLALPGSTGAGAITGVNISYLPTVPLATSTDTTTPVAINTTVTAIPGTDNPATAPDIAIPAAGEQTGLIDVGVFAAGVLGADRIYKLTVTEADSLTATVNWANDADIDVALCSDAACANDPDFTAATGDQPESATYGLQPGTYFLIVNLFADGTAPAGPPAWISIQLQR